MDAQDVASVVIYAEARLGELLRDNKPLRDKESYSKKTSLPSLPPGISKQFSHQAQTIAKKADAFTPAIDDHYSAQAAFFIDSTVRLLKK